MRITKAALQAALEQATRFNCLPLRFVGQSRAWRGAEERIRSHPGFVAVHQYGRGMLPLLNEFGTDGKVRYILRPATKGSGISKYAYEAFGFGPSTGGVLLGGIVDAPK